MNTLEAKQNKKSFAFLNSRGKDIKILGLVFVISGFIDLIWILSYPEYTLKIFGTTFEGWVGALVKFQHPIIHWAIGYGFWHQRHWAFLGYLVYLVLACLSEVTNQLILGFNEIRASMIIASLLFGAYIVARRNVFQINKKLP
ncbi:MAG: hypothetical protein VX564_00945 [Nitrospirota bacterium]|nr:hypothetical protein [Nitrospirota bacterium]